MKYYKEAFTGIRSFMHKTSMIRFAPTLENGENERSFLQSEHFKILPESQRILCQSGKIMLEKKKLHDMCTVHIFLKN